MMMRVSKKVVVVVAVVVVFVVVVVIVKMTLPLQTCVGHAGLYQLQSALISKLLELQFPGWSH